MKKRSEIVQTRLTPTQHTNFTKWKEERGYETDAKAARNLILQALDHAKDLEDMGDDIRKLRQDLQRQHQEISTLIDSLNVVVPAVLAFIDKDLTYEEAQQKWLSRVSK
jgi:hypothetical protein